MRSFNLGHRNNLEYPMTAEQLASLGPTRLVSPRIGNDHGYQACSHDHYESEVIQLLGLRAMVEAGRFPSEYLEQYTGQGELSDVLTSTLGTSLRDPRVAADTVQMDHPFDIWDIVIEPWANANSIQLRENAPTHEGVPFVETVLNRATAHALIAKALDKSFDVKNAFGMCRPTEYYDCSIQRYPTPNHPEMPAGHGAFSGAGAKAFELIYQGSEDQIKAVHIATQQFAMFRSFSAMHIPYSNMLGWKIGYETEI